MNEAKKKISFKQFSRKTKIISITSLSALILTATLAGAQVATSANGVIVPQEVALKTYTNGPPAVPSVFSGEGELFDASDDASVVVVSPRKQNLYIKSLHNEEVKRTDFTTTTNCKQAANITSVDVSANGETIAVKAGGDLFPCLAGLTDPIYYGDLNRVWILKKDADANWQIALLPESNGKAYNNLSPYQTSSPTLNAAGTEVFFSSNADLGFAKFRPKNFDIYSKNLLTDEIQLLSDYEQTGSAEAGGKIISSESGRYVGWNTGKAYTSRALSDEASSSVEDFIYVDREKLEVSGSGKIKMQFVPFPQPLDRSNAKVLSFKEVDGKVSIIYNATGNNEAGAKSWQGYAYYPEEHKLYNISDRGFQDVSKNGKYAISSTSTAKVYRLYTMPALVGIEQVKYQDFSHAEGVVNTVMLKDRIFYNDNTSYARPITERAVKW